MCNSSGSIHIFLKILCINCIGLLCHDSCYFSFIFLSHQPGYLLFICIHFSVIHATHLLWNISILFFLLEFNRTSRWNLRFNLFWWHYRLLYFLLHFLVTENFFSLSLRLLSVYNKSILFRFSFSSIFSLLSFYSLLSRTHNLV